RDHEDPPHPLGDVLANGQEHGTAAAPCEHRCPRGEWFCSRDGGWDESRFRRAGRAAAHDVRGLRHVRRLLYLVLAACCFTKRASNRPLRSGVLSLMPTCRWKAAIFFAE